uniref:Uncharacterized protein n=1 Tax=Salix viminalis TaxID=40686 RepID=A0A6N2N121_SALVM
MMASEVTENVISRGVIWALLFLAPQHDKPSIFSLTLIFLSIYLFKATKRIIDLYIYLDFLIYL